MALQIAVASDDVEEDSIFLPRRRPLWWIDQVDGDSCGYCGRRMMGRPMMGRPMRGRPMMGRRMVGRRWRDEGIEELLEDALAKIFKDLDAAKKPSSSKKSGKGNQPKDAAASATSPSKKSDAAPPQPAPKKPAKKSDAAVAKKPTDTEGLLGGPLAADGYSAYPYVAKKADAAVAKKTLLD